MTSLNKNNAWIIVLLGLLSVVTPFAIDMYLPAFSHLAADFHTTTAAIDLSLSTYFIGFALGQILYGPLLDRFGRKRPLYFGLVIYIVASIGCAQAHSIHAFTALRFIQALGGCVAQVAAIAMVRDFFHVRESARVFSLLFLIIGTSPLLAPTVGSLLVSSLSWRWIFLLLAANALVILTLTFTLLPKATPPTDPSRSARSPSCKASGRFSASRSSPPTRSPEPSLSPVFLASSPAPPSSSWTATTSAPAPSASSSPCSSWASSEATRSRLSAASLLEPEDFLLRPRLSGLHRTHLLRQRARPHPRPASNARPLLLFLLAIGLTFPNAAAIGMAPFSKDAGSASALLGFLQAGVGSAISMGIGVLGATAIVSLLSSTAFIALLILLIGRTRIPELIEAPEGEAVTAMH